MNEPLAVDVAVVFNGFLGLSMKEKFRLVDLMNEFFDYPDKRADIRKNNEQSVENATAAGERRPCKCCRK